MARLSVFVDTNTLVSGVFFPGLENTLLNLYEIELVTADICVSELFRVARRKYSALGVETEKVALEETGIALEDTRVIAKADYESKLETAKGLLGHQNDQRILAAALTEKPDYFVTGDFHFHTSAIRGLLNIVRTRNALEAMGAIGPHPKKKARK